MQAQPLDRRAQANGTEARGDGGIAGVIARGRTFLSTEFRRTLRFSVDMSATPDMTSSRPAPTETFTSMLVLELMARRELEPAVTDALYAFVRLHLRDDRIHFFTRPELLPADIDCTSLGVSVLFEGKRLHRAAAERAADLVAGNVDERGHLVAYFKDRAPDRAHVDPAVCVNALYLLHLLGRARDAAPTEALVHRFLVDDEHLKGTRYYQSPDTFLFFLARLCARFPEPRARFAATLASALDARVGATDNALEIALRVLARQRVGLDDRGERRRLCALVGADGSFPSYALFRAGKRATYYGCAALTTAFAVAAIDRRDGAANDAAPSTYYAAPS